jgi:hypothetical protein
MTDEVGVVTGELTLETALTGDDTNGSPGTNGTDAADGPSGANGANRTARLRVQYRDADEWYTVTGGCFELDQPSRVEELHHASVELLTKGGQDVSALELPGVIPCGRSG